MNSNLKKWLPWVLCAVLGAGCCVGVPVVGGLGYWLAGGRPTAVKIGIVGPSATGEGLSWSHGELIEHLKRKGLKFTAASATEGSFWGPVMKFSFDDGTFVLAQVRKTAQDAKDQAAVEPARSHSWGRFLFVSQSPGALSQIKRAID